MGYIKSSEHFINYINKIIKENSCIDKSKLLDSESYIDFIYKKKLSDHFTWAFKENPCLIEGDNLIEWLRIHNSTGPFLIPSNLEHKLTADFSNTVKSLKDVPGVYSFWSKSDKPLYVGLSCNLQDRILGSFHERFKDYKKEVYLKYIKADTASNACVLEVYFIGKLKPALNGSSKYSDNMTIKILEEPKFSNKILCNRIKKAKP